MTEVNNSLPWDEDDVDRWYSAYDTTISDQFQRAIQHIAPPGGMRRGHLVDAVARQLQLDPDRFRWVSYVTVYLVLKGVDRWLNEPPGDILSDRTSRRGENLASEVLVQLDGVDDLLGLAAQFGLAKRRLAAKTRLSDIERDVRGIIIDDLSERLYRLLKEWRERGAWSVQREPQAPFRKHSRDVPAEIIQAAQRRPDDP